MTLFSYLLQCDISSLARFTTHLNLQEMNKHIRVKDILKIAKNSFLKRACSKEFACHCCLRPYLNFFL
jgi:hypothetical protein